MGKRMSLFLTGKNKTILGLLALLLLAIAISYYLYHDASAKIDALEKNCIQSIASNIQTMSDSDEIEIIKKESQCGSNVMYGISLAGDKFSRDADIAIYQKDMLPLYETKDLHDQIQLVPGILFFVLAHYLILSTLKRILANSPIQRKQLLNYGLSLLLASLLLSVIFVLEYITNGLYWLFLTAFSIWTLYLGGGLFTLFIVKHVIGKKQGKLILITLSAAWFGAGLPVSIYFGSASYQEAIMITLIPIVVLWLLVFCIKLFMSKSTELFKKIQD